MEKSCSCSYNTEKLIFACSGACDLGQITDMVARKIRDKNIRKMNCLAVVGAGIEKSIEDFKKKNILLLDGCPTDCGKRIFDNAGIKNYKYIRVTDFGYIKGGTPVTEEIIDKILEKISII